MIVLSSNDVALREIPASLLLHNIHHSIRPTQPRDYHSLFNVQAPPRYREKKIIKLAISIFGNNLFHVFLSELGLSPF